MNKTLLIFVCVLAACGRDFKAPSVDETGDETGTQITAPGQAPGHAPASTEAMQTISLSQATNVRKLVGGVLEFVAELPPGSRINVPVNYTISQPDIRNSDGTIERSSTGFVGSASIISATGLTSKDIAAFNKFGLYVSASVVAGSQGVAGDFKAVSGGANGSGFLSLYASTGKPKFNYTAAVAKRFGKLNHGVDLQAVDKLKYQKIMAELARAADRKAATPKSLILMDRAAAKKYSLAYEANGTVAPGGSWTIAVTATAVRHGFENVPCAEFMSETLRQAYQRAGYSAATDFGAKNPLIWSRTASVQGLSNALYQAGWAAWEPSKYRPPTGAIMMHGAALSPGHTFMAAGDDGRIVIDNGSPQGRDLRTTSESTLRMMYKNGVFFLPPGITPKPW